jgi:hypothetical protein
MRGAFVDPTQVVANSLHAVRARRIRPLHHRSESKRGFYNRCRNASIDLAQ